MCFLWLSLQAHDPRGQAVEPTDNDADKRSPRKGDPHKAMHDDSISKPFAAIFPVLFSVEAAYCLGIYRRNISSIKNKITLEPELSV